MNQSVQLDESDTDGVRRIAVRGEMTIYTAAELHNALCRRLPLGKATKLDLSGVTEIDTAGLQLLVALQRQAESEAVPLVIDSQSPAVRELAALFHFSGVGMTCCSGGESITGSSVP